jgi:hypothetical protein
MKTLVNNRVREWQRMISLLFTLFFMSVHSQNSSEFPLNDPRNPNCPCHKFQKLAEEEYKNLMARGNSVPVKKVDRSSEKNWERNQNKNNPVQQGISSFEKEQIQYMNNLDQQFIPLNEPLEQGSSSSSLSEQGTNSGSGGSSVKRHTTHSHTKWKRKRRTSHFRIITSKFEDKYRDLLKEFRNVSRCYHWN